MCAESPHSALCVAEPVLSLAGLRRHPVLVAGPLDAATTARLAPFFEVERVDTAALPDRAALVARLAGKSALMAAGTPCVDATVLRALPHLKAICKMGPGHAAIDLDACTRAQVMVTDTADCGDDIAAQARMQLAAADNLIAIFGFGRAAGRPPNLLNTELRCMLGCCC